MKVKELIDKKEYEILNKGENLEAEIKNIYCCDMLSIAMSKMPKQAVWVTVVGNVNTIAVAVLTDVSCVILAEGIHLDKAALDKAKSEGITVLLSKKHIFDTAYEIKQNL